MACEDFPCCGHEPGCCPNFDEHGRQTNMICVCGAVLPINNRVSICDACLRAGDDEDFEPDEDEDFDDLDGEPDLERQELEDFDETDEAYGYYGDDY